MQAVANSVNERVNARLKDKTGEKADYGKTLLIKMPEVFAVSTLDKPVSTNFGQAKGRRNGGNGGEEDDPLAGWSPEEIEALRRRLGKK